MKKRLQQLDDLEKNWAACTRCQLHVGARQVVQWRGSETAQLFVVGEAPSTADDRQGLPFIGRSGRLLDSAILKAGLNPSEEVFFSNRLGCNLLPEHRADASELSACLPRLSGLIEIVKPKVLLLLGDCAADLIGIKSAGKWRGLLETCEIAEMAIPAMVSVHPDYVLARGGLDSGWFDLLVEDVKLAASYCARERV